MTTKKIATAIDILINVDRFEHLQITKYGEREIEYETEEERIEAEDKLTAETVEDGIRSLNIIPNAMGGKTVKPSNDIMQKVRSKLPTWLSNGTEPNIANLAETKYKQGVAENDAKQEEANTLQEEMSEDITDLLEQGKTSKASGDSESVSADLFENKEEPKENKEEPKEDKDPDADLFGEDEDLFS